MVTDRPYFVALSQAPGIGNARFKVLIKHFEKAEKVWKAPDQLLKKILDPTVYENFNSFRQKTDPQKLISEIENKNIQIISSLDSNYPEKLKEISDPPAVLYVRGELKPEDNVALGVVGTRKITSYGREVTELLVRQLSQTSLTIVSGLARGVDSLAHKTALENGARTLAVLGCGVDIIYPPENTNLAKEILKNGAIISEIKPGVEPSRGYFPARNRIISGLSLGVLVTEADEKSGSLITASLALEQNREVFAVPGPIYSKLSKGPSDLIKQGAKLVTNVEDILEELNLNKDFKKAQAKTIKAESKEEELILSILENENKHIDQIVRETKLSQDKLNQVLITMELSGKIKNLGSGNYSLNLS